MPNRPVEIRPARPGEGAAVSRLMQAIWHHTYDPILDPATVEAITSVWHAPERFERQIASPGLVFLVAEQKGRLVGHSAGRRLAKEDAILLERLYVAPFAQRQGIGQRLLKAVIERLPPSRSVRLRVAAENVQAVRFYERLGFRPVGAPEPWDADRRINEVRMERQSDA